jgi:protein gp37
MRFGRSSILTSVMELACDYLDEVFDVMEQADWHVFQILTKRPGRMAAYTSRRYASTDPVPAHLWFGTSVEDERVVHRLDALRAVPGATRFLSCEPLIGPLYNLDLTGVAWVIVGG